MLGNIKRYFKLKKLYKDSKKVLVINAAETITSIKNVIAMIEKFVEKQEESIGSITKDDLSTMTKFMSEMTNTQDFKDKMYEKIHEDANKLREMEAKKQASK